jgi:catalase
MKVGFFVFGSQDLYEAIERGDYPEWELFVQIMEDGYHPELDFDPLDDTKLWPEDQFPWLPVGRMVLDRNPVDFHAEIEQAAFGTGVLVDGMDFSDDKMLQDAPFRTPIPSATGLGLIICSMSAPIDRPNNYGQAGDTYRRLEDWEREKLIKNLSEALAVCDERIQKAMIEHFTQADEDYGRRVREGIDKIMKEIGQMHSAVKVPGREAGISKYGQGSMAANEATKAAVKNSREADPY